MRCQVVDVDPLSNDEIDAYIGRLPGCQELDIPKLQKDARWSEPIEMESLTDAMPNHKRKGKPDKNVIKSHRFVVKVRSFGPDSTRRTSLSGSSVGSGRRGSTSSNDSNGRGRAGSPNPSDDMAYRRTHH